MAGKQDAQWRTCLCFECDKSDMGIERWVGPRGGPFAIAAGAESHDVREGTAVVIRRYKPKCVA